MIAAVVTNSGVWITLTAGVVFLVVAGVWVSVGERRDRDHARRMAGLEALAPSAPAPRRVTGDLHAEYERALAQFRVTAEITPEQAAALGEQLRRMGTGA